MRRLVPLLCLLAILAAPLAEAGADPTASPQSVALRVDPSDHGGAALIVHYIRLDDAYDRWNLWSWTEGAEGRPHALAGTTSTSRYAVIDVPKDAHRQGLIVRRGDWESRDIGHDRYATLEPDGLTEVWLVSGDPRVYTDPADIDLSVRLVGAFLDASRTILLAASGPLEPRATRDARVTTGEGEYAIRRFSRADVHAAGRLLYEITLARDVAFEDVASLSLEIPGFDPMTAYARDVLSEPRFTALDADLGPRCTSESTTFSVWTPVCDAVDLLLFDEIDDPEPARTVPLAPVGRGVWETTVEGDLHATAYLYRYRSYGVTRLAPDIHARAATIDSSRSVVVNLDRTNPEGWASDTPPTIDQRTDEIIYEVHVRDFSIADTSLERDLRGTYLGLAHRGAVAGVRTGLAHLEELGVTAVHLLPIHDYPGPTDEYNWGYWTTLFNVPESNYSSDPSDPMRAIIDLKTAVAALHDAGLRVVLDVVYNHTSSSFEHSAFDQSVPWYYFRTTPDGQLRNDAGVGNSIADERPMVRKYILDSAEYWVRQYRVDGLRFDLLGTHTPETVAALCERLAGVRDDLTIYGEPWTGGGPLQFGKGAQRGTCMAVFNDHLRNAIRGDLDGAASGFATGPGGDVRALNLGLAGAIDDFADDPAETINYVSAHDNLTLWDKIERTNPAASDDQKRAMHKLALGLVLTSQGAAFLHGGSDFCRTKGGNHNSYNAGDEVNAFDWARKAEHGDVFQYVRGLIALRRAHPAFRMSDPHLIRQRMKRIDTRSRVFAFTLDGRGAGDDWRTILVAANGEPRTHSIRLPGGRWTLVVNDTVAGTEPIHTARGTIDLPPYSMVVLHK